MSNVDPAKILGIDTAGGVQDLSLIPFYSQDKYGESESIAEQSTEDVELVLKRCSPFGRLLTE